MPDFGEDAWINEQTATYPIADLEDCSIAVEATYYLQGFLTNEPLLPALGNLNGIQAQIEEDLDKWAAHKITPLFVFDGQPLTGQDEVTTMRARLANESSDRAWDLYFNGQADEAVSAFGRNMGAFRLQTLFPLTQKILRDRKYHFLVPPFNAAAQIAYFDMIDSDQCAGIMGSQELLLYPIRDCVIRSLDWDNKVVVAISKKHLIRSLNLVNESALLVDALLMSGTSFLNTFSPLKDPKMRPQPFTIYDAVTVLRTTDKNVTLACSTFQELLERADPTWLDKYRKARMAVSHFIYIDESGEVKVHDPDTLTRDNHEYLGLQLPSELFHYLNVGLISPRVMGWITHGKLAVHPTLDGVASEEYKKLVSTQLLRIKEQAVGIFIPRLNRGIQFKPITLKAWYERKPDAVEINPRALHIATSQKSASWVVTEEAIKRHLPDFVAGSIVSEVLALKNADFVQETLSKERLKGITSADTIVATTLWRFLHLRDYIDDQHQLTTWGEALAAGLSTIDPVAQKNPTFVGLHESMVVALELLRLGLLNNRRRQDEVDGLPINGTEDDKASLLLISRCGSLLKLRHKPTGYTGPLSKSFLGFRSLASEVRATNRDLIESLLAFMFLFAQAKRERDDCWEISQRLPFLFDPDIALGIALKTYLDDVPTTETPEQRTQRKNESYSAFMPHAVSFSQDFDIATAFFDAIHAAIKTLPNKEVSKEDKATWATASAYLELRR